MKKMFVVMFVVASVFAACGGKKNDATTTPASGDMTGSGGDTGSAGSAAGSADAAGGTGTGGTGTGGTGTTPAPM